MEAALPLRAAMPTDKRTRTAKRAPPNTQVPAAYAALGRGIRDRYGHLLVVLDPAYAVVLAVLIAVFAVYTAFVASTLHRTDDQS
eukprot:2891650-Rhodomonas_salina.1